MPKKLTTKQFIERAKAIHGNKYNYSLVEYINNKTSVKIICKKHGVFEQRPSDHLNGHKCPLCARETKKLTKEQFIEKAKLVHGDKYDYSLVEYINSSSKVKIICKKHGMFEQKPIEHLNGHDCMLCSGKKKKTTEQFIEESKIVHGDKYDYSLVEYVNNKEKVRIICPEHGEFKQSPIEHINGQGCPVCSGKKKKTTEQFIKEANLVHNNKYDYSQVEYINTESLVKIFCPAHGLFEQTPHNHLQGACCPKCNISKGENSIKKYLEKNNIEYEQPKKYVDLKDKGLLSYDFYIPDYNLLIEYNGKQHYQFDNYFYKSEQDFHKQLHHDWLKRKYAKTNNIKLLTISYKQFDNIDSILKENISDY